MWKEFLTSVGNVNTCNSNNHQVLKLKCPSINHWQSIYLRIGQKAPTPIPDLTGLNLIPFRIKHSWLLVQWYYGKFIVWDMINPLISLKSSFKTHFLNKSAYLKHLRLQIHMIKSVILLFKNHAKLTLSCLCCKCSVQDGTGNFRGTADGR